MPALQVREFPDELYEELRAYAARNRRSIAQQTIACVENEIRRSKALETAESGDEARIAGFLPASVREASTRAQAIDPFKWLETIGSASEEETAQRRAKLEKLGRQIDEMQGRINLPKSSCEEIAQMVRDEREGHSDRVFAIVEERAASRAEA